MIGGGGAGEEIIYREKGLSQTLKDNRRFTWTYRSDITSSVNLEFMDGTSLTNVIPLPGNSTLV